MNYAEFLQSKIDIALDSGFELDPFGGLMTVPTEAVKAGRRGIGVELNAGYFLDGVGYLQAADAQASAPTLFDFIREESTHDRPAV